MYVQLLPPSMRKVDESYQPIERERGINSPAVRTVAIIGVAALAVVVGLFWWTRVGKK